jgi:hypothetical protein
LFRVGAASKPAGSIANIATSAEVIRHHVAQRDGILMDPDALRHAHGLGRDIVHVIDAVAIPDRLEQAIGTAESDKVHSATTL